MRNAVTTLAGAAWLFVASLGSAFAQALPAPSFTPMANEPDPRDFVSRSDSQLTVQGTPFRFGGVNITWLGMRQDGAAPPRRPTKYEVQDALQTAQALGATVVRAPGLLDTAGCPLCVEPASGQISEDALVQADLVLATARDLGIKIILPLADSGHDCVGVNANGAICGSLRLFKTAVTQDFFSDSRLRVDFNLRATKILNRRNSITGTPYHDDPTIMAWENCDACAAAGGQNLASAWSEQLGITIKAVDKHHLYENGAFAGHIGPSAKKAVDPDVYATQSVDIVGDRLSLTGDTQAARGLLAATVNGVTKGGRAYMLDNFGWSAALWKTTDDLNAWLGDIARTRALAGALTGSMQSHADQGGYLPPVPPVGPGLASLYFPGIQTADMDVADMRERGRALRRFNFTMADVTATPAYLLPPQPEIISAAHGRVTWRGAAGAATYTIERTADPGQPDSWTTLCESCVTDVPGYWQDPAFTGGAWYRVMPLNINGHKASPSEPVQAK